MDMDFHVKSYCQLFDKLQKNVKTVEELFSLLKEQMQEIVRLFPLGKFEIRLIVAPSILDPEGQDERFLLYENEEGFDEPCCREHVQMDETCSAVFEYYPVKGTAWSPIQEQMLLFLSRQLFLLLERVKLVQLLECIAVTDLLTGALNTRGINETGGKLLARQKLKPDEYFARMGGDNFVLLAKKERMGILLEQIDCMQVTVPYENGTKTFDLRSRIGVYDMRAGQSMGEGLNAASTAMHAAKMSGKADRFCFDDQMVENALRQKEVSQMFPKALADREFVVYYQPKVTLVDNQLCGCEALVRWFRDGAMVPPMDFIPVLEREGSVCKLDFYVLEQVCRDVRDWKAKGIEPVRISVNFSKVHLQNPHLAEEILAVLQKYEIPPKYIEVELTEMSGYENYKTLLNFVRAMRANGVSTSIDDFGTGYSSLNLLKDLNVDIIKLDKSFLSSLENHRKNDVIVIKNIIKMVNELDMEVIAEGVETVKQAEFLRGMHCCMAQGFLFDRPLPHDDFEKRLSGDHVYSLEKAGA